MAPKVVKTSTGEHGTTAVTTDQKVRVWMQVVVSFIFLFCGIVILAAPNPILSHQIDEGTKKWAAGWVGAVGGYWLS